ncbi:YqjF family protein [Paenibacillus aestuarii]|uniref:YqjF family protein n=1 Tax=Paenibacillus aestuarii TaxID=516965 RepID=A0ABW0K7A0_9BACL|nr:DUF2071 domain-containing protein [Paenibacillus aestuarii]
MSRPYPLPNRPWVMKQTWNDLLFAHWPIDVSLLRPHVPASLPIDTYDGTAWIGVVPFHMTGVTPRGLPPLPYFSAFPELNLRTYVNLGNKPGVYFFSLDAQNRFMVEAARLSYRLPYYYARIQVQHLPRGTTTYTCIRDDRRARPAGFAGSYRPTSDVQFAVPGSLDYWLTERYCLYSTDQKGSLYRGEIDHDPWPLQKAEADILSNTLTESMGITLPDTDPILHFAKTLDVRVWLLQTIR